MKNNNRATHPSKKPKKPTSPPAGRRDRAPRPGKRATTGTGRKGKRNPTDTELEAAADLSEGFHGRPARTVKEVSEIEHSRDTLADLGRLISLVVWVDEDNAVELDFKGVRLAASPDGGQLYLIGNQRLDLAALGLADSLPKDHITIGPCESITYHTQKGFHDFAQIDYEHTFAEDDDEDRPARRLEQPTLCYDVLSQRCYLTGGSYRVRPQGIVN